jgi:hypothetical protein
MGTMLKNTTEIKKGDVIVGVRNEVNDPRTEQTFDTPITVDRIVNVHEHGTEHPPTVHFQVKVPKHSLTGPDRYLGVPQVRVGRAVTLAGIKFLKMDDDLYVQVDGPWRIEADFIPYECDDAHPVKLTPKKARMILSERHLWSYEAVNAAEAVQNGWRNPDTGKFVKGYMCPGCEEHHELQWCVHRSDYEQFDHQGMWQDTPTEAAKLIAEGFYKED